MKIQILLVLMMELTIGLFKVAAQNTTFTYQGRVLDNSTNFTGTGQFKFALVTSSNINQQAYAYANGSGGFITSFYIASGGSGYTIAPTVTISGGGGSGAVAIAHIDSGKVTSISVNNPGNGDYTNLPDVIVTISAPPPSLSYTSYWSNDGTSIAGSEPTNAVSVNVSNGLFTVVLGDTTLANMTSISASLFLQQNLQLRIWFNDGMNGSAALSPLQNLTPAPYAISAASLSGTLPAAQISGQISPVLLPNVAMGVENLRIIRGTVGVNGTIIQGTGFTVQSGSSGNCTITFTTPFSGYPTVVASIEGGFGTISVGSASLNQATIQMWGLGNYAGSPFTPPYPQTAYPFSFIAVGPQ